MTLILSGTNGLSDVDGDASTPAVRGTDANSGIFFGADQVGVATNGVERVEFGNSETVFNDGGANLDFRVEGDTETNLLFVDAGNDRVGIGTASPSARLHILTASDETIRLATSTTNPFLSFYENTSRKAYIQYSAGGGGLLIDSEVASQGIVFATQNTEKVRIDSSGNLLVGTTSSVETNLGARLMSDGAVRSTRSQSTGAASTLDVYSTGASAFRFYVDMAGTVFATNTSISAISDVRHKENIRDLDVGLAEVMQLQPRVFDWKEGKGKNTQNDRGFIAQEFEQVFPDLIDEWKDPAPEGEEPYKSVRQDLIPVLVKAVQELKAELDTVKAELATLKG